MWLAVAFLLALLLAAALAAAVAVPVVLFLLGQSLLGWMFALMSALVFYRHRANISRLMAGTETRIGAKG